MAIYLAYKTLTAIEESINADGGAAFRVWEGKVLPHIGDAYRGEDEGFRSHMGASLIGRECARELWYGFRWFKKSNFSARMLRLFNRGHLEEGRFIAMLLSAGMRIVQQDEHGNQFRISRLGGHFGGSGDGIVYGCPDVPEGHPALCEFKTHSEKSFIKLKKEGVASTKPEHFVQMQCYMYEMKMHYALYMAVNKNTDDLYAEIVMRDDSVGSEFLRRGETIVMMQYPPKRISTTAAAFKCKFCDYRLLCHYDEKAEVNCRTCAHAKVILDGTWECGRFNTKLDKQAQLAGCSSHQKIEG